MADSEPRKTQVTMTDRPHAGTPEYPGGQVLVIEAALRFRSVAAVFGRSAGKTSLIPMLFIEEGGRCPDTYDFAYCAPTQRLARKQYRAWKLMFSHLLDRSRGLLNGCSDQDLTLHILPWNGNKGATLDFWGLDEHDNLRGARKHRIVVDECKDVAREAIYNTLMPMRLARSFGGMLFIGTPSRFGSGAAWFRAEYAKGQNPEDHPGHWSCRFPSHCNPYLTEQEIADMIADCDDEKAVREEIWAEFLEDEGSVFENLKQVFTVPVLRQVGKHYWIGEDRQEVEGHLPDRYLIGFDIGRAMGGDPSCITVFNAVTRRQAALRLLHGMSYGDQIRVLHEIREAYGGARIYYDQTGGHGMAMTDELHARYGDSAIGVTWTQYQKEADISAARFLCQRAGREDDPALPGPGWYLMQIPRQREEWDNYQMVVESRTGARLKTPRYGAPSGLHDDTVTAACLLAGALRRDYERKAKKPEPIKKFSGAWMREYVERSKRSRGRRRRVRRSRRWWGSVV